MRRDTKAEENQEEEEVEKIGRRKERGKNSIDRG